MEIVAATAAVNKAVDATLPLLLNAAIRSVKYPFDVGANVKVLQSAMNDLLAKKEDVNTKIENGERVGEKVTKEVSRWIEEVEAIKTKVEEIEQRYQARYKCLGSYSFNCRLNYTISKSAVKTLLDVQRLYTKSETYESVTMPVPPPDVQEVSMEPITSSTSDDNLTRALECINNGHVGVIGLLGMGGVGKTCLLQRINNNYTQNPNNFKVVFVTASQECSIAKLQSSIAEKLNLATHTDEEQQATIIFNFLKEKNFLLLLDDLWDGFDLKKIGIPFPLGLGEKYNRKVVLTTRLYQVCGKMGVGKEIGVACLNEKESWSLFREKVGNDTLDSHPLILSLAKKVIDQLGGLPLALIIIGSVMYGKRDPRDWRNAIDQIRSPNSGSEESLYHRLKFSYENLGDETLKKCFLSCSLWPEDETIERDDLIRCWIGLDYIKESDMQKAHDMGHTIISTLLRQNLLEEMLDDYYCSEVVKMHDVIRSMALWIACDFGVSKNKWVIKAGVGLRELPINNKELWCDAECVSLMHNRITELKCPPLSFPSNLTTLMLNDNENLKCFYPKPLTRLRYLDLSHNRISDFPLEICELVELQHLDLSSNRIESIPDELKSLINLRFLYLAENEIRYFPEGVISGLKSLEVLDFCRSNEEMKFEPYFFEEIKCLENLKDLGITVCNLSDLEKFKVLSTTVAIRSLLLRSKFKVQFSSTSLSSNSLCGTETESHLVKLHIWNNRFKEFVIEAKQFPYLEELYLDKNVNLVEVMWRGVLPMNVFPRLRMLYIFGCGMEHLTWIVHLPFLLTLRVHSCFFMKELVRDDQEGKTCFPSLKIMKLSNMENLESICDPNFAFPSLRILRIDRCPKLKKLPFTSQFSQLGPAVLPTAGSAHSSSGVEKKLESLPGMVSGVYSEDATLQLEAMTQFRKLLLIEMSPPIEEVIQAGVVPRFVQFLTREDYPQLQFEAVRALTNIAYLNTKVVVDHGAVPILVKLLGSGSDDVRKMAMWALGNVAADSPRCRDLVLANGALLPLLAQLNEQAKLPMLRKATWALSSFCSGEPQPQFDQTKPALSALARLIHSNDEEVLTDACGALSYLSDGTNDKIQAVIDAGVCPRLVELLRHPSPSVHHQALRTVGNIVSGDDLQTQCIIDHQALPCLLNLLTQNHKKSIKKEACWTISNITARNKDQIQAVIAAGILGPLINLLQTAELDIKKEAAWALSNATRGGTHDQIRYLVNQGCIKPLCDLLICPDPRTVTICLEGLENILKVGEAEKNLGATGNVNLFAQMIDEAEGLEKIKNLQSHDKKEICEKAVKILETYWLEDEDDGMGAVHTA